MDKQVATDFVIRELGKHHQRNDIVERLCELNGISWGAAEKFVQQVEAENRSAIARKQSPMITFLGLCISLGGLGLMIWVTMETLNGYIIFFLSFPIPYLGNIAYFLTGLVMMVAGLWGMWDTILRIWDS